MQTRRQFLRTATICNRSSSNSTPSPFADPLAPYRTPYKFPQAHPRRHRHTKATSTNKASTTPSSFYANNQFNMLYIGFDGTGYQTGLATSARSRHTGSAKPSSAPRDPASKYTKFNLALSSILRNKDLHSRGEAIKINGRYLGAWNAYPSAGYEAGAAVIGLAWSHDLLHWDLTDPILFPAGRSPLGARRPLPPRPPPPQRHLLPLLQRQDRHPP